MIEQSKIRRKTVDLCASGARPSRIRREPPAATTPKEVRPYPTEREILVVVVGVILFALALTALMFGISDITAK